MNRIAKLLYTASIAKCPKSTQRGFSFLQNGNTQTDMGLKVLLFNNSTILCVCVLFVEEFLAFLGLIEDWMCQLMNRITLWLFNVVLVRKIELHCLTVDFWFHLVLFLSGMTLFNCFTECKLWRGWIFSSFRICCTGSFE